MIPALSNELDWSRGASKKSKDNVHYIFKNGSEIDILAARESSRGQRRTGILIEESILVDGDALNEIIIPTTNIDRNLADGSTDPDEVVNQSQIYITTAGWKNSFPYEKLIEIFNNSAIDPDQYMILGGNYELSIIEGMDSVDIPTVGARSSIRLEMSGFFRASMGLRVSSHKKSSQVLMRSLI